MKGTNLVEELPYAHAVETKRATTICANCMKDSDEGEAPHKRCSRCQFVHYCGAQCQKEDWKNHKNECRLLCNAAGDPPPATVRLLCRIILKRFGKNKAEVSDEAPSFNGRTFESLISHEEHILNSPAANLVFTAVAVDLRKYMAGVKLPPESELVKVFGKVFSNSLSISGDGLAVVGLGLYIGLSELDHSCSPDSFVLFNGAKATLRTLKEGVTSYDSSLRICYTEALMPTAVRRLHLAEQYFFTCNCTLCSDVERDHDACSVLCNQCEDGFCPVDVAKKKCFPCKKCGKTSAVDLNAAIDLMRRAEKGASVSRHGGSESMEDIKNMFRNALKLLSPVNVWRCWLANCLSNKADEDGNFRIAAQLVDETIPCFERYYSPGNPVLSVQLQKSAAFHMCAQSPRLSLQRFKQALPLFQLSHGVDNPTTVQVQNCISSLERRIPM